MLFNKTPWPQRWFACFENNTPIREVKLKGCPWCGEMPEIMPMFANDCEYIIQCINPGCYAGATVTGVQKQTAVVMWNKRYKGGLIKIIRGWLACLRSKIW